MRRWRDAMTAALYGPDGFFVRPGSRPAAHFRTSALASPGFAAAVARLLVRLDAALDRPDPLTVVDVGAGAGELLTALARAVAGSPSALPDPVRPPGRSSARVNPVGAPGPDAGALLDRLRLVAVERARRPDDLPAWVEWRREPPTGVTGLLLATEWLDNVPLDVAELDDHGVARYVLVDPGSGEEAPGEPVTGADADWLDRWWPLTTPGQRAEIGRPRDEAWAAALATLARGAALAVDYGHRAGERPPLGTLTGYRHGRQVPPVPDGSRDLTAHVAIDAVAEAGAHAGTGPHAGAGAPPGQRPPGSGTRPACPDPRPGVGTVLRQREALAALGVTGDRPPWELASSDPAGYLHRLVAAGQAAELTDPTGLGGHHWVIHSTGSFVPGGLLAGGC